MAYTERKDSAYYTNGTGTATTAAPVMNPVVEYHDRVRWGPIFAGIVVSIASQLVLSALGAAIGFTAGANGANAGTVAAFGPFLAC